MFKRIISVMSVLACVALLAACSSKLTNENLSKVKSGMSEAQVLEILGKPTKIETGETLGIRGSSYLYEKGKTKVQITFVNDAVIGKSGNFE
jgi:hypothetical protein